MKRNLRPGDLRDMSLGQLQVITNDLHSQIQGKESRQYYNNKLIQNKQTSFFFLSIFCILFSKDTILQNISIK